MVNFYPEIGDASIKYALEFFVVNPILSDLYNFL